MDRRRPGPVVQHVPGNLRPRLPAGPRPGTYAIPRRLADGPRPRPAPGPGRDHGGDRHPDRLLVRVRVRDGIPPTPRRAPTPLAAARASRRADRQPSSRVTYLTSGLSPKLSAIQRECREAPAFGMN